MNELKAAIQASRKAGDIILRCFDKKLYYKDKGYENIVSKADIAAEKAILKILLNKFPNYAYYSEEAGYSKKKSENMWVIDPLDGTNNFAIGLPIVGVSISLFDKNGLKLGVSYQPFTKTMMHAERGKGVFINGKRANKKANSKRQTVSFITGYKSAKKQFPLMLKLSGKVKRVISTWAPSIDYQLLCAGKIDTIVSLESEAADQLSGLIFAKESDCIIKTLEGKDYNPKKFEEITPKLIISRDEKSYLEIKKLLK